MEQNSDQGVFAEKESDERSIGDQKKISEATCNIEESVIHPIDEINKEKNTFDAVITGLDVGAVNPDEETFNEDEHQKEQERVNLVGIINKNISKLCKESDYGKNETAQRKVRTIFNIITESGTAEEIYDKILDGFYTHLTF